MKEGRVFLIEDDPEIMKMEIAWIKRSHQVVLTASSVEEALEKIEEAKKEEINVAVIDGNLGTGTEDGRRVAASLKKEIPAIVTISFSGSEADWADYNLHKPGDIGKLNETIGKSLVK